MPTSDLPKIFVLSAALLWATGFIYNKLEHRLSIQKIILLVLLFNLAFILTFRLLMPFREEPVFLFIFLSSFNIIYLLNNLEFWGLAAQLFDVRQSKRLFSVVSAGDIPAKMLGYISAVLLIPILHTENLLWLAAAFVVISLMIYRPLMQTVEIKSLHQSHQHHVTQSIRSIQLTLTGNIFIRHLALVSFFSFCCFLLVNFVFYGYIKDEFKTDKALAGFFGVFLALIRGTTLIVKLAVTNRLVDKIGLRNSLLITPITLFILCVVTLIYITQVSGEAAFYLFGIMAIIIDVLRSSIQTPVMLAALQPLPTHQRLRGHTIIKGLMDPFAFLSMGILLWVLATPDKNINFNFFGIILLVLIICWIVFSLSVDKKYIKALFAAIQKRSFNERNISVTDSESLKFLLEKMDGANEADTITVLRLISKQPVDKTEFFEKGLKHISPQVKLLTLKLVKEEKNSNMLLTLHKMLEETKDPGILREIINTLTTLDPETDLSKYLEDTDNEIVKECINAYIKSNNPDFKKKANERLTQWFESANEADLQRALWVSGRSNGDLYTSHISRLMQHHNTEVRQAAYEAAGLSGKSVFVEKLFSEFQQADDINHMILSALEKTGDYCLPAVKSYLWTQQCEGIRSSKLIMMLGRMQGAASLQLLEECLLQFPGKTDLILPAILKANKHVKGNETLYKKAIREKLDAAAMIVFCLSFLDNDGEKNQLIKDALTLELTNLQNNVLDLFSFLYDSEKIKKAKAGFDIGTKESIANSLELVQVSVAKEFASLFISIFENSLLKDKLSVLRKIAAEPALTHEILVKNILFDVRYHYNNWTKACVLYSLKEKKATIHREFIRSFTFSEDKVLKNTAEFIISETY